MKKLPGFISKTTPEHDKLKPHSRGESLHPGTPLANVTQGYNPVTKFSDMRGTSATFTTRAGAGKKRVDDPPILQPGVNTAQDPENTDVVKGGRKAR